MVGWLLQNRKTKSLVVLLALPPEAPPRASLALPDGQSSFEQMSCARDRERGSGAADSFGVAGSKSEDFGFGNV